MALETSTEGWLGTCCWIHTIERRYSLVLDDLKEKYLDMAALEDLMHLMKH